MIQTCARCGRDFNGIFTKFKGQPEGGNPICQRCRGAAYRGEKHPAAKLSDSDVREIRQKRAGGQSLDSLAAEYGMHRSTVGVIVKGRGWAHVA